MRGAVGSPYLLYLQMLFSFAALTFALPSASTRGRHHGARVRASAGAVEHSPGASILQGYDDGHGLPEPAGIHGVAAGGITPVVASGLLGDFSWTQWFVIMSVPFYANLIVGGTLLFLFYRSGFRNQGTGAAAPGAARAGQAGPKSAPGAIVIITGADVVHRLCSRVASGGAGVDCAVPDSAARVGILTWGEFERNVGWTNFFVIATSLSLSHALVSSGAAAWFSETLVGGVSQLVSSPMLILLALCVCFALLRMLLPNIAGYLALVIPVTMAAAESLGLNPLVCGFAAVVVGDSAVYYGAGGTSAVFVFQRANIANPEIFRFGITMTVAVIAVLLLLVVPYWGLVGYALAP